MNRPKLFVLFSLLITFFSCSGQAESGDTDPTEPSSELGTAVSELPAKISVIFQDSKSNYWFGSGGAYRYDGNSLVLFTTEEGLCSNTILGIQEDEFGNIYFDTPEGVSRFDGQKFISLEVVDNKNSQNEWKLEANDLWFRIGFHRNGPYRYDGKSLYQLEFPKTDQAEAFYSEYPNASYNPYGIYTMYADSKGRVWFGTASLGVCRFDGTSINWLYEKQLSTTPSGGDFGIRSIIEDKDGYFWFCNTRHRYEILPDSAGMNDTDRMNYRKENGLGRPGDYSDKDLPYFMSIVEDNSGELWMASYNDGVWRSNGEDLIHYPLKDGDTDVLLFSIYKDKQGVLWLGTRNAGVYKFNGSDFEKFRA